MFDTFGFPAEGQLQNLWVFYSGGNQTNTTARIGVPWAKPRGISTFGMLAIGSGGGGGGGHSAAAGNNRGGGGGGGSATFARLIIPAFLVPETLYVFAPAGGAGGPASTVGVAGDSAFVGTQAIPAGNFERVLQSDGSAAGGGGAGTGSAGGPAGSAATISLITDAIYANYGAWVAIAGRAGGVGGAHTGALGGNVTTFQGGISLTGGAGGGGTPSANTNFAGGDIASGVAPYLLPAIPGGAGGGGAGGTGSGRWQPFAGSGGSGGGTNGGAGVGGKGGDAGWFGCGGGGGGGGVTGGAGGRGGDGLVIIWGW